MHKPCVHKHPQGLYEEIEVIAKAGQGAFGSVYVAMWRVRAAAQPDQFTSLIL